MQLARGAQTDRDRENELGRKKGYSGGNSSNSFIISIATTHTPNH